MPHIEREIIAIFGLAVSLWLTEYRRQHFPTRQGSPA
jgi:hypothetical protein